VIGGSVAFASRWFSDRATERISLERMESIGRLISNAPFPLTPQVLSQLKQLSQLELAIIGFTTRSNPSVSASTIDLPDAFLKTVEKSFSNSGPTIPLRLDNNESGAYLGLLLPSGNKCLLLLQPKQHSGFFNESFLLPLITGLLSAIGVGIVATWKASRITRRIGVLKQQVESIAAGHTITAHTKGPNDDIFSLQVAMRLMSIELAESKRKIAENERSRLIQLLASGLAHELRNHLTGAKLALQTCESDATDREAISIATQQMDLAEQQVRRLLTVQTGIAKADDPSILCATLLKNVVDLVRPMANHRQVRLDVFPPLESTSPDWTTLTYWEIPSGNAVTGAILNLVINAIEAAGPNGKIEIHVSQRLVGGESDITNAKSSVEKQAVNKVLWQIRDNGQGPAPQIASQLFEPFITSKPEGVGLGLAMCKRVAISLGGSISWNRSNGWTCFELCIPIEERKHHNTSDQED